MKKTLLIASSAALLALAAGLLGQKGAWQTNAGASSTTPIEDSFRDSAYAGSHNPDVWNEYGKANSFAQEAKSNGYLHSKAGSFGGEHVYYGTKTKQNGISSVSFDWRFSASATRWTGFNFINGELKSSSVSSFAYSSPVIFSPTQASSLGGTITGGNKTMSSLLGVDSIAGTWVHFEITVNSASSATYALSLPGKSVTDASSFTVSLGSGKSFQNAYFGIQTEETSPGYDLANLSLVCDDGTLSQNFSRGLENDDFGFVLASGGNTNGFSLADDSALNLAGANAKDRLISVSAISEDTSIVSSVITLDLSFRLKLPTTFPEDEEFALVIGLADPEADPYQDSTLLVMGKEGGRMERYVSGKKTSDETKNQFTWSSLSQNGEADIEVKVNKDGSFHLLEDGIPAKNGTADASFEAIASYAGHLGFMAVTTISGTASFSSFKAKNVAYYVPRTKSVTHNFSNSFFGNEGHEDFWYREDTGTISVEDGRLAWNGCSDGSFFGSAYPYDCFILDYKINNVYVGTASQGNKEKTEPGKWFGLDLSRSAKGLSHYGSYGMVFFEINPATEEATEPLNLYTDQGSALDRDETKIAMDQGIPVSWLRDICYDGVSKTKANVEEKDALCVRYVSDGANLDCYMKKASQGEFLHIATLQNAELNGYFALCCTGYTYLQMDDFSMANTSSVYTLADNESPETITETKTVTVYDPGNVDVNLEEELKVDKVAVVPSYCWVLIGVFGALALAFGVSSAFLLIAKKKGGKQ